MFVWTAAQRDRSGHGRCRQRRSSVLGHLHRFVNGKTELLIGWKPDSDNIEVILCFARDVGPTEEKFVRARALFVLKQS